MGRSCVCVCKICLLLLLLYVCHQAIWVNGLEREPVCVCRRRRILAMMWSSKNFVKSLLAPEAMRSLLLSRTLHRIISCIQVLQQQQQKWQLCEGKKEFFYMRFFPQRQQLVLILKGSCMRNAHTLVVVFKLQSCVCVYLLSICEKVDGRTAVSQCICSEAR